MIDKTIRKSKKLRDLKNDKSRLLYFMIYPHIDSEGRFSADPDEIKIECVPFLQYSERQIAESVADLYNVGLIKLGISDDEPYLEITRFRDFNNIREDREGKSKYPSIKNNTPGVLREYACLIKLSLSSIESNELMKEEKREAPTATQKELLILKELKNVKGFPFDEEKDLSFIRAIIADYPEIDHLDEFKKRCAYWLDHPLKRNSSPRAQIRTWFKNARRYNQESKTQLQVGSTASPPIWKDHGMTHEQWDMAMVLYHKQKKDTPGLMVPEFIKSWKEGRSNQ